MNKKIDSEIVNSPQTRENIPTENSFFLKEIMDQLTYWPLLCDHLSKKYFAIQKLIQDCETVFTLGRGSSNHAVSYLKNTGFAGRDVKIMSLPLELVVEGIFPIVKKNERSCILAFSASGSSSEIVRAAKLLRASGHTLIAVTNAHPDSDLSQQCQHTICLNFQPEKAVPASKSFSGQLLVSAWLSGIPIESEVKLALTYLNSHRAPINHQIWSQALSSHPRSVVWLGNGANASCCADASLKTQEVLGLPSRSFSVHEFLHGPIGACSEMEIVFICHSEREPTRLIEDILNRLNIGNNFPRVFLLGSPINPRYLEVFGNSLHQLCVPGLSNSLVFSLVFTYLFQTAISDAARKLNRNADKPERLSKVTHT